jgi:hypothetical protein
MTKISYSGYRFPPEIIQQAIWFYVRFTLSFRDVEDLLAERGILVSYETVRRWVNHFGPKIAADLRKRRRGQVQGNKASTRSSRAAVFVTELARTNASTSFAVSFASARLIWPLATAAKILVWGDTAVLNVVVRAINIVFKETVDNADVESIGNKGAGSLV